MVAGICAITLENTQFNPSTLAVKSGATVTVVNKDEVPHPSVDVGKDYRRSWRVEQAG